MAKQSLNGVLQHIRKVAAVQTDRASSDRELLERFIGAHDESAFTVLIERHGPMVLGVCRRALPNSHDAEDACQAAFLVLARKAASVRRKSSLSSWLHGVACRVAADLKRSHARRKSRERGVKAPSPKDPAAEVSWREVQAILDEELQRLPERQRAPVILCYLECMTRDEAAQQLGLSSGSLHGRLERGRELLREHLTKRGLTLAAVMSASALGENVAQAALAPTFVVSSTKAAMLLAAGQTLTESVVATHVTALTQEVLKSMLLTKMKLGAAAVLCAGLFVAMIGGSFTSPSIAQDTKPMPVLVDPAPAAVAETPQDDQKKLQGAWRELVFEQDGLRLDEETLKNVRVVIAGNTIHFGDRRKPFRFKLDPSQRPKEIQFSKDNEAYRGIYDLTGDDLKLCYVADRESKLPTDFTVPQGSERRLIILKREKPATK